MIDALRGASSCGGRGHARPERVASNLRGVEPDGAGRSLNNERHGLVAEASAGQVAVPVDGPEQRPSRELRPCDIATKGSDRARPQVRTPRNAHRAPLPVLISLGPPDGHDQPVVRLLHGFDVKGDKLTPA